EAEASARELQARGEMERAQLQRQLQSMSDRYAETHQREKEALAALRTLKAELEQLQSDKRALEREKAALSALPSRSAQPDSSSTVFMLRQELATRSKEVDDLRTQLASQKEKREKQKQKMGEMRA